MLLSWGPFPKTHMVKYSKYYRLTRTFGIQAIYYGSLGCDGSNRGVGNETRYGTTCESPGYHLLTILSSHVSALTLTSAFGTSENTRTKMQVSLPLLTQTGSKDTSQWSQFLLGGTGQRYGLQLIWWRCVFYTWPVILIMTFVYSDFLILRLDLVSCSILEHCNTHTDLFGHPPFDMTTTRDGVYHPLVIRHFLSPCATWQAPSNSLYRLYGDHPPSGSHRNPQAKQRRPEFLCQSGSAATNLRPSTWTACTSETRANGSTGWKVVGRIPS